MVNYISSIFKQDVYKNLLETSDGICIDNGKEYIDFDKFIENLYSQNILLGEFISSCDTLLLEKDKNHIIFVEFKDMNSSSSEDTLNKWWKDKSRIIYLKITDSTFALSYYLKNHHNKPYDDFMNVSKSFFYVYKSDNFKNKIHSHLKYKFSRYDFLFKNIKSIESRQFEKFLEYHKL